MVEQNRSKEAYLYVWRNRPYHYVWRYALEDDSFENIEEIRLVDGTTRRVAGVGQVAFEYQYQRILISPPINTVRKLDTKVHSLRMGKGHMLSSGIFVCVSSVKLPRKAVKTAVLNYMSVRFDFG